MVHEAHVVVHQREVGPGQLRKDIGGNTVRPGCLAASRFGQGPEFFHMGGGGGWGALVAGPPLGRNWFRVPLRLEDLLYGP